MAASRGVEVNISTHLVEGALDALQNDRADEHDALIAHSVRQLTSADVIVLGQFSMARAAAGTTLSSNQRLLTTPDLAVQHLRRLVGD